MPIIDEEEWESGTASTSGATESILEAFKNLGANKGMDMAEVKKITGLKWIFGPMKQLVEAGKLERKKFGKRFAYRLVAQE